MKTKLFVLTMVLSLVLISSSALAISLTDYKFPRSTSQEAYVNGTFNLSGLSADSTQTGYDFTGSATYDLFYRSLPFSYFLNARGNFSLDRPTYEDAESEDAYNTLITTRANKYLSEQSDLFGFGSARLEYRKLAAQDEADDPYVDVTAGVGYGRTIDATVLKQAMRMNEDFKKYGVITGNIPDDAMLELAGIIDREDEYRSRYGEVEYKKYWYEDMEDVIRKSGVLKEETLGAMGLIRIQEVLEEKTGNRYYGWEARAGVGYVISDFTGESGDPRLSLEFDWARPYSIQLQLTNDAYMYTVLEDDPTYNFGNIFDVYYEVSNRIDWDNNFKIEYNVFSAEDVENTMSMVFSSTYIFYIENQLTFNPNFTYNYFDDGIEETDAQWNWSLTGSISYRLK